MSDDETIDSAALAAGLREVSRACVAAASDLDRRVENLRYVAQLPRRRRYARMEGLNVSESWEVERERFMRRLGVTHDDDRETR